MEVKVYKVCLLESGKISSTMFCVRPVLDDWFEFQKDIIFRRPHLKEKIFYIFYKDINSGDRIEMSTVFDFYRFRDRDISTVFVNAIGTARVPEHNVPAPFEWDLFPSLKFPHPPPAFPPNFGEILLRNAEADMNRPRSPMKGPWPKSIYVDLASSDPPIFRPTAFNFRMPFPNIDEIKPIGSPLSPSNSQHWSDDEIIELKDEMGTRRMYRPEIDRESLSSQSKLSPYAPCFISTTSSGYSSRGSSLSSTSGRSSRCSSKSGSSIVRSSSSSSKNSNGTDGPVVLFFRIMKPHFSGKPDNEV